MYGKKGSKFNRYSPELKKQVAEAYLSGNYGGAANVAKVFGIKSSSQVKAWVKLYQKDPVLLLKDGRHLGKKDGVMKGKPKKIDLNTMTKDERIEALKLEVAILKKAKALRKNYGEH